MSIGDIVERLKVAGTHVYSFNAAPICQEAAAELTRRDALIEELQGIFVTQGICLDKVKAEHGGCAEALAAMTRDRDYWRQIAEDRLSEIIRLRISLDQIGNRMAVLPGDKIIGAALGDAMKIARAALSGGTHDGSSLKSDALGDGGA